jgi:hypothetical protein
MKSLIICSERKINYHIGEYYDVIIEVPHQPMANNKGSFEEIAKDVRQSICDLWKEDVEDTEREGEPCIEAYLDAASPFNAMLIDYQIVMKKKEKIKLELPYLKGKTKRTTTSDDEANKLIEKLESRGEENA